MSTWEPKATNGVAGPASSWKASSAAGRTRSPAARSTKTTRGRHCAIIAEANVTSPATRMRWPSVRAVPVTFEVKIRSRLSRIPGRRDVSGRGSGLVHSFHASGQLARQAHQTRTVEKRPVIQSGVNVLRPSMIASAPASRSASAR